MAQQNVISRDRDILGGTPVFAGTRVPVQTKMETFALEEANTALNRFRAGELKGTAVLTITG